jgi:hypothetical protein
VSDAHLVVGVLAVHRAASVGCALLADVTDDLHLGRMWGDPTLTSVL